MPEYDDNQNFYFLIKTTQADNALPWFLHLECSTSLPHPLLLWACILPSLKLFLSFYLENTFIVLCIYQTYSQYFIYINLLNPSNYAGKKVIFLFLFDIYEDIKAHVGASEK